MRSTIWHILLSFAFVQSPAFASSSFFSEGVKAHGEKNYSLAAEKFMQAIEAVPNDKSAYYNLGLAEMGNRHYGSAIWAFEKVLKFDPNDTEALTKLERCQAELNPTQNYTALLSGIEATLFGISSNAWSILAIVSSFLVLLCLVLFKLRQGSSLRRVLLISGVFFLLLLAFSGVIASREAAYMNVLNYAIVTVESAPTYMDKENASTTKLEEGTRLHLLEESTLEFIHVEDAFGQEHLVKASDLRFF